MDNPQPSSKFILKISDQQINKVVEKAKYQKIL